MVFSKNELCKLNLIKLRMNCYVFSWSLERGCYRVSANFYLGLRYQHMP